MKKINQVFALRSTRLLCYVLLFCFGCFFPAAVIAQSKGLILKDSTTLPDNTYGKGKKTTLVYDYDSFTNKVNGPANYKKEKFYDGSQPDPKLLQEKITIEREDGSSDVFDYYYNCDGKKILIKSENRGTGGLLVQSEEKVFDPKTGSIIKGKKTVVDKEGKKTNYTWDKNTNAWVETTSALPDSDFKLDKNQQMNCSLPSDCNSFFIGSSTIFEDNNPDRFNTFGGNVAYIHPLSSRLGITGDAGIHFGSNKSVNYTKLQVLVGVSLLPVNNTHSEFSFSPHLLAGVSNVSSKYKTGGNSYSNSSTGFSLAAGTDISYSLNNKTGITARLDYNPTFSTGGVKNNFRLSLGVSFRICPKSKSNPVDETMTKENPLIKPEYISNVSAHDFDKNPPIFNPEDATKKNLANPYTEISSCEKGEDEFEYDNNSKKDVDATLVVTNEGQCKVYVYVEKLLGTPAKGAGNKEKKAGDTEEKNKTNKKRPKKPAKEKTEEILSYGIEDLQGSDIHSFKIAKGERIRVYIMCDGKKDNVCKFTRNFSVTKEEDINVSDPTDIPRLPVSPPKPLDKIPVYQKNANECMSQDLVFYKITNKNVADTMKVYFKAVSD